MKKGFGLGSLPTWHCIQQMRVMLIGDAGEHDTDTRCNITRDGNAPSWAIKNCTAHNGYVERCFCPTTRGSPLGNGSWMVMSKSCVICLCRICFLRFVSVLVFVCLDRSCLWICLSFTEQAESRATVFWCPCPLCLLLLLLCLKGGFRVGRLHETFATVRPLLRRSTSVTPQMRGAAHDIGPHPPRFVVSSYRFVLSCVMVFRGKHDCLLSRPFQL